MRGGRPELGGEKQAKFLKPKEDVHEAQKEVNFYF